MKERIPRIGSRKLGGKGSVGGFLSKENLAALLWGNSRPGGGISLKSAKMGTGPFGVGLSGWAHGEVEKRSQEGGARPQKCVIGPLRW